MNLLLKLACLLVYLLALAKLAGLVPPDVMAHTPTIALAILVAHVAELMFFFRHVRLYRGPLAVSVLLTLLFGLLHWKPLADAQAREQAGA
jgi:uncharacterized membrane protein HdeD (DUF308 family)